MNNEKLQDYLIKDFNAIFDRYGIELVSQDDCFIWEAKYIWKNWENTFISIDDIICNL